MDAYEEHWHDSRRAARKELKPLIEAVWDAVLMFEDIKKARELPATAQAVQQYVAMGNQLRRLLDITGLKDECDVR
jgi:hypothetical protein